MESENINIIKSNRFSDETAANCKLILWVSPSSLILAGFDTIIKTYVAFEHILIIGNSGKQAFLDLIEKLLEKSELNQYTFKSKHLIWQDSLATLVPNSLYQDDKKESYLNFNQTLNSGNIVLADKLKNADCVNIFAVPERLTTIASLASFHFHHHHSVMVESLMILNKISKEESNIYINIGPGFFDLVIIQDRLLKFHNSFSFASAEDFIYYVLFTFEQLKINADKAKIELSGDIMLDSPIYEILYKYVRFPALIELPQQIQLDPALQHLPAYRFFYLFNFVVCEL